MNHIKKRAFCFGLCLLTLAGCGQWEKQKFITNHHYDYQKSESVHSLVLPPRMELVGQQAYYPVPEAIARAEDVENKVLSAKEKAQIEQLPPQSLIAQLQQFAMYAGKIVPIRETGYTHQQLVDLHTQQYVASTVNLLSLVEQQKPTSELAKSLEQRQRVDLNLVGTNAGHVVNANSAEKQEHVLMIALTESQVFEQLARGLQAGGFRVLKSDAKAGVHYFINPPDTDNQITDQTPIYQLQLVEVPHEGELVSVAYLTDAQGKPLLPKRTKKFLGYLNTGLRGKPDNSFAAFFGGIFGG